MNLFFILRSARICNWNFF